MGTYENFKESSRRNWRAKGGVDPDSAQLMVGCLQRIADSVELMAKSYQSIINDRDYFKRRLEEETRACERLNRRNAALRGHLRRCKKGTT